jgi:hypothetical protein
MNFTKLRQRRGWLEKLHRKRLQKKNKKRSKRKQRDWRVLRAPGAVSSGGACHPESAGLIKIQRQAGGGWTIEFPNWKAMYAYDIRQTGRSISFARMVRGSDPELNTDYLNLTVSVDRTRLKGTNRSISISGDRPHWITDECEYIRQ